MLKNSLKKINRKRSITKKKIYGGTPHADSHQETLYNKGYKLYQDFLKEYELYYEIDDESEPERYEQVVNRAQKLLFNAIEKLKNAVNPYPCIENSDELTKNAAFLVYELAKVDEDDLTYDMRPSEVAEFLKIAADLDHGKACYLYSQLPHELISWKGYSSPFMAKEAYLDKAWNLSVPEVFVFRANLITENPESAIEKYRTALSLLCEAYELYKYLQSSYTEEKLVLKGYTSDEISRNLERLQNSIANVFKDLFMNKIMYIVADSKNERIEELDNLISQFNDNNNENNRLFKKKWDTFTREEQEKLEERYYTLEVEKKKLSALISEIVIKLNKNDELTDNLKDSHPLFRPKISATAAAESPAPAAAQWPRAAPRKNKKASFSTKPFYTMTDQERLFRHHQQYLQQKRLAEIQGRPPPPPPLLFHSIHPEATAPDYIPNTSNTAPPHTVYY